MGRSYRSLLLFILDGVVGSRYIFGGSFARFVGGYGVLVVVYFKYRNIEISKILNYVFLFKIVRFCR